MKKKKEKTQVVTKLHKWAVPSYFYILQPQGLPVLTNHKAEPACFNQPELAPAIAKCAQKKRHRKL